MSKNAGLKNRFLLGLTPAEIGAIRSLVSITIDSGDFVPNIRVLQNVIEKIDAAKLLIGRDAWAFVSAADDILDAPDVWESWKKGLGNAHRARDILKSTLR